MKVLRLDLLAYGPFTNASLDLADSGAGMHIVYGPNEAGKSTALRALRHLLYGIPERSTDAFRHPFPKLRIGGLLRSADGRTLEIVRRKGRTGTLRRPDDSPVAEDELKRFLNGVDAEFFSTMFGIGYEDLVAGGSDIVRGGGDLGRLLFAAGSGSAPLGRVLGELQAETAALFLPTGQKPRINEGIARLKLRRSELAAAQLMGADWARHERDLGEALRAKDDAERELAGAQTHLHRLQRFADAHPAMAGRREALNGLAVVAHAVPLPDGFGERRVQATTRLRVAENERDQAEAALAALRAALDGLGTPQALLAHAEQVEAIHQELGSQRKAARDSVGLEADCTTHRAEARSTLRALREDLALDQCERLRIRKLDAIRIQELGGEYERIAGRIESTRSRMPELERQAAAAHVAVAALPPPIETGELRVRLGEVEAALAAERQVPAWQAEGEAALRSCADMAARLGLESGDLQSLCRLAVPNADSVHVFEDRFDRLEHELAGLETELQRVHEHLSDMERRREEARLEADVPTEADLQAARDERDERWRLIRRRLEGPADEGVDVSLPETFEAALRAVDQLADRLRREADRVASKARLLSDLAAGRTREVEMTARRSAVRESLEAASAEWSALWRPVPVRPGRPREMRRWVVDYSVLVEKTLAAFERRQRCETAQTEVRSAVELMTAALAAVGESPPGRESLAALSRRARAILAAEDERAVRRAELEREGRRLRDEITAGAERLKSDEADLERWKAVWTEALHPLGIHPDALPAEAMGFLEESRRLFHHLEEAEKLQKRLDAIRRDAEAFGQKVRQLAGAVAPELCTAPPEDAVLELQRRLTTAREVQSRRGALLRQAEDAEARSKGARATIAEAGAILAAMCAEAGCRSPEDLPAAERRSAERQQLERRLAAENERLLQLCGGASLENFIREASEVDPDAIEGAAARLREDIRRLTVRKSELDQKIGTERAELNRMDGSDGAARIAEDIQAILGGLEHDIEHYARLRVAAAVLGRAIERFRERNQGPILRRACDFFRTLTCGSFEGLRAEHLDDRPVIVGVRSGGDIVPVAGMSDGTADQLFLALRLAGLEHYIDRQPAMPFVVDDILIKFDDDRAAAALRALAVLAARTQVIFFTHHRHLLDLAAAALDPATLFTHTLPAASIPASTT